MRVFPRSCTLLVALLTAAIAASGCSDRATDSPLSNARQSPDALARAALEALAHQDEDRLAALMVTRHEYRELLWPVLPDRHQMPFDFAWSITGPRSRKARRNSLESARDIPLELVRVELGEDVETYDAFTLHRRARMVVRRTDTGEEGLLPLMDTLVEMEGGWKFMNFVDDA